LSCLIASKSSRSSGADTVIPVSTS
jgi:hypothetical protein